MFTPCANAQGFKFERVQHRLQKTLDMPIERFSHLRASSKWENWINWGSILVLLIENPLILFESTTWLFGISSINMFEFIQDLISCADHFLQVDEPDVIAD